MATALASQLAQIRAKSSNPLDLKAQRKAHSKSLLFDHRDAANQDFDTIYQLCHEGYLELCQLDSRFTPYAKNLFSEQSKEEDRMQMTEAQNNQLNGITDDFLALVGSRLLLKPALKSVEWLVRRFRVHEHTTASFVMTFLPYHMHPMFTTVLTLLPESIPPALKFLFPYVQSLKNPSRHTVVYTAIHNQAFFSSLSAYVLRVCRLGFHYAALLSFWASIVTEATAGMIDQARSGRQGMQKQNQEDAVMRLMPILNGGLSLNGVSDLRVGCYMVVTVLASKAVLSDETLAAFMDAVVSKWVGTTHAGLICLAVLAQRRDTAKLPRRTFKALMSIQSLEDDVRILKSQYEVRNLVLGVVLGILGKLRKDHSPELLRRLPTFLTPGFMDLTSLRVAVQAMQQLLGSFKHVEEFNLVEPLSGIILQLAATEPTGQMVREVVLGSTDGPKSLQLQLENLGHADPMEQVSEDHEMIDVDQSQPVESPSETFDEALKRIETQTTHESSFLSKRSSHGFHDLIHAFALATDSSENIDRFSNLPFLRKLHAMKAPAFMSFFIRAWAGPYSVRTRAAAIDLVAKQFETGDLASDVQILLPYIFFALADPSSQVRRGSSRLAIHLAKAYKRAVESSEGRPELPILGQAQIYGEENGDTDLSWLNFKEVSKLLQDFFIPNLEESSLDPSHVVKYFGSVMNGTEHTGSSKSGRKDFKTSWKRSMFLFICSHVKKTPLLCVKSRLLQMLNQVPKAGGVSRTKELLPLFTEYVSENQVKFLERCSKEQVEPGQFMKSVVELISPTDREGVHALEGFVEHRRSLSHPLLQSTCLEHIRAIWPWIKHDLQASIAGNLLESALSNVSAGAETSQANDAIDILRTVKLSSSILSGFLKQLSLNKTITTNGMPAAKRRKKGHDQETCHATLESVDMVLRRFTIVLELVDSSGPESHPELLKEHFDILEDLEAYQRHSGAQLGYLEVLTLDNAYRIINGLTGTAGSQFDHSAVKADVLISCVSTTENPQVQRAALLLVASIASAAPELILHSVMPIFTFMGTGIMRNSDDYSAHVVKKAGQIYKWKTMDSVILPLVQSLHKKKNNAIIGASELLLSFVAAYKDIPQQRREDLFLSLSAKIGADDFLFALVLLLVDKYPGRTKVLDFAAGLVSQQSVTTQLRTVERSLDTVLDCLKSKPTVSVHLLNNKDMGSVEDKILNVIPLLCSVLKHKGLRAGSEKLLNRGGDAAPSVRSLIAKILEQALTLRNDISGGTQVAAACNDLLHAFLDVLTLENFVETLPELFEHAPVPLRVQALQSLEMRLRNPNGEPPPARDACLTFMTHLTLIIEEAADVPLQRAAIACTDQIAERFGKKDINAVSTAASTISSHRCLAAADNSVRIAALLCLATVAEVLGEAVIPIIPQAFPIAMDHLIASLDEDAECERLHDACYAFVTSSLLYIPWVVTGDYLDRLLKVSHESANAEMGEDCDATRIEALRLVAKTLEPKDCFAALDRTWTNAMAEGPLAVKEHLGVLRLAIEGRSKSIIAKQSESLAKLFLKVFDLRRIQFSPRTEDSYEDQEVEDVETAANDTLIAMIYKINDAVFRPIFIRFLEWSTSPTLKKDRSKIYRQTTLWTFLLNFFGSLKSIVTSYAGLVTADAVDILNNQMVNDGDTKLLWERVILTLQSAFEHDQDDFFQSPTHFPPLCSALLSQISLIPLSPYAPVLLPHLITTITLLATTTDAQAQHKLLCSPLLQYMRDESAAVRLAAVKTQLSLTDRLGEEWLAQLPEMLPFISEGMEDDDERVEMEFRRWVKRIEEILGESIASMLQ